MQPTGTVLHVVGQRGEVVIAKEARDSLRTAPGPGRVRNATHADP